MTQNLSRSFFGRAMAREAGAGGPSLWMQARDILRDQIKQGRWRVGERLPGIGALAATAGVSPNTIKQAIESLGEVVGPAEPLLYETEIVVGHPTRGVLPDRGPVQCLGIGIRPALLPAQYPKCQQNRHAGRRLK